MDRIIDLANMVQHEVTHYADFRDWKAKSFAIEDDKHQVYAVIVVPQSDHPLLSKASVTVMARVVENYVVIEQDITDRPLYEALMEAGIPREQIILAYAGEKTPGEDSSKEE